MLSDVNLLFFYLTSRVIEFTFNEWLIIDGEIPSMSTTNQAKTFEFSFKKDPNFSFYSLLINDLTLVVWSYSIPTWMLIVCSIGSSLIHYSTRSRLSKVISSLTFHFIASTSLVITLLGFTITSPLNYSD